MDERMVKMFNKEEEFIDNFESIAVAASDFLNHEWQPNYSADDFYRSNLKYFFYTGEVNDLVFDSACVYHIGNRFSSVQIVLKSSFRLVTVRVKMVDGKYFTEKVVERN